MTTETLLKLLNYRFVDKSKPGKQYLKYENLTEEERKIFKKREYEELIKDLKKEKISLT